MERIPYAIRVFMVVVLALPVFFTVCLAFGFYLGWLGRQMPAPWNSVTALATLAFIGWLIKMNSPRSSTEE
ncbi:MAG: hypothetical protein BGO01_00245 [Armatimonadetes bacterium 55-13]|nr:hypothetical protein [Armatimonadota bacterium]ODU53214.1 MAG: hypothetical protein ABT09_01955 [bacterium SCN 57-13]OJU63130.1 MAG: hypothetical protein BGO01_00245 [Armatimonadetes bacterium 55-13]